MRAYLHPNLASASRLTSSQSTRYSGTACVRLLAQADGIYRVEVTDGRRLAIIQGLSEDQGLGHLETFPDGPGEVLIPADQWAAGFKLTATKDARGQRCTLGIGANAASILMATPGQSLAGTPGEGTWPNVSYVLPRKAPLVALRVDAALLVELLQVASKILDEETRGVMLLYYGPNAPLGIAASNPTTGQVFDGLLVPLTLPCAPERPTEPRTLKMP